MKGRQGRPPGTACFDCGLVPPKDSHHDAQNSWQGLSFRPDRKWRCCSCCAKWDNKNLEMAPMGLGCLSLLQSSTLDALTKQTVQINPNPKGVRPQTTPTRIEKLEPKPVARSVKKCCRCKSELPLDEFFRDRSRRDGLTARCKECCYDHYNEQRRKRVQAS